MDYYQACKIWLDGDSEQIVSRLPEGYYCQEVSFIGDQNLLNTISVRANEEENQGWKIN